MFKHLYTNAAFIKYVYYYDITEYGLVVVFLIITCYLLSVPSQKSRIAKLMNQKKRERMEMNKIEEET
jgi:hypothetical protein